MPTLLIVSFVIFLNDHLTGNLQAGGHFLECLLTRRMNASVAALAASRNRRGREAKWQLLGQ